MLSPPKDFMGFLIAKESILNLLKYNYKKHLLDGRIIKKIILFVNIFVNLT